MTDDAELRARIEAQVAARRAGSPSSENGHPTADEPDTDDSSSATTLAGGPRSLTPTRPWTRAPRPPENGAPKGADAPPEPAAGGTARWRGIGPARPWAGESVQPPDTPSEPAAEARGGRLRPARPWHAKSAADSPAPERAGAEPPGLAPSHPDIVLRAISRDSEVEDESGPPPAAYVPDDATTTAFAEAAGPMLDLQGDPAGGGLGGKRRKRRRTRDVDAAQPRHAEPPAAPDHDDTAEPAAPPAPPEGVREEPNVADVAAEYPWQHKEEVDLDLRGASTWDPAMYPPEPEQEEAGRGRRALRWLLARSPERAEAAEPAAAAEPPAPEAAAEAEPAAAAPVFESVPLPVADLAAALAEREEPRSAPVKQPRSLFARLFGRRRAEDEADEPDEQFELPEPDAAFDEPWLRAGPAVPRPTRDWSRPSSPLAGPPAAPAPEEDEARAASPDAAPDTAEPPAAAATVAPEPAAIVEPEPVADVAPVEEPTVAVPPAAKRRPSPGAKPASVAAVRPTPGAAARPAPGIAASPRRPRPGSGEREEVPALSAPRPLPFERAAAIGADATALTGPETERTTDGPDLSRFLEATEAKPEEPDEDEAKTGGEHRWRQTLLRLSILVVIAALAAVLLRVFVVQPYYIPSESMEPTLHGCSGCNNDHVLVDKISYHATSVKTGDIVVFHRPSDVSSAEVPESVLIKRVIAVGGDKIAIKKGEVFVNNRVLDESYVKDTAQCRHQSTQPRGTRSTWRVPDGDVFVMGDNRCDSTDSRTFGPIPTSSIIGRAFAIIWPINRVRLLNH